MKPWLIGLAATITLIAAALAPGLAAGLAPGSRTVAGGSAPVTRCDTDGVRVVRTLVGANVTSVTVSNIAAACGNGALSMTVNNGATTASGSAVVPVGGGSVVVTLGTPILVTNAMTNDLTIVGA